MRFNEKMQNLYANLSKGGTLSRKELEMCGFNSTDITAMARNNILRRVENKRGEYTLVNVKGLYGYGKACLKKGDVLKAMNCLLKCVEYDPTHVEANFQLFGNFIEARNFA